MWASTINSNSVSFSYLSCDGEEGYPGNLNEFFCKLLLHNLDMLKTILILSSEIQFRNLKYEFCVNIVLMQVCFPGDVVSNIVYQLTEENALKITFTAMTNKPTLVNMGSHCFFNLGRDIFL